MRLVKKFQETQLSQRVNLFIPEPVLPCIIKISLRSIIIHDVLPGKQIMKSVKIIFQRRQGIPLFYPPDRLLPGNDTGQQILNLRHRRHLVLVRGNHLFRVNPGTIQFPDHPVHAGQRGTGSLQVKMQVTLFHKLVLLLAFNLPGSHQ